MRKERQAQASMFKGAFGNMGERRNVGLWEDPGQDVGTAQMQGSGKLSMLGWVWALVCGWLAFLFGLRSWRR
jgi:hypothetical protein